LLFFLTIFLIFFLQFIFYHFLFTILFTILISQQQREQTEGEKGTTEQREHAGAFLLSELLRQSLIDLNQL
jgi:hypothetical protein